jgi:hypothetical protein
MRRTFQVLAAALLTAAGACRAPDPVTPIPRQWIEVGMGPVLRGEERTPEVEDDWGWHLGGGYDLYSAEHLRGGFELQGSFARHDVAGPSAPGDSPQIDAWTWMLGGRLQTDAWPVPFGAHLRAGGFYRFESDLDSADVALDQGGVYLGGGLDWWFKRDAVLSVFVLRLEGSEDLDETWLGLSARFFFAPDPWPENDPDW